MKCYATWEKKLKKNMTLNKRNFECYFYNFLRFLKINFLLSKMNQAKLNKQDILIKGLASEYTMNIYLKSLN